MTRPVLYMAHPVGGDVASNLDRAERWLTWLRTSFRETTFIAPWITAIRTGENDDDPAQREMGLVDDCAVVERCDAIVLVGGRVSSGMDRESKHSSVIFDLTPLGDEPPGPEVAAAVCGWCEFARDMATYRRPTPAPTWGRQ